ncbi:MAG: hypothetical protein ABFS38_20085 [Bacteroidota bacterium]
MPKEDLHHIYSSRIHRFQEAIRQRTRLVNYISLARFMALVAVIWFLALGIRNQGFFFFTLSFLMVVLFLYLVTLHNKHAVQRELHRQSKKLNETEQSCLDHSYEMLPHGSNHADPSHPWSHDLDIFGKGSLFQYLNRTATLKGDQLLAGLLTTEPGDLETIQSRQEVIGDLKDRIDFRQNFTARGHLVEEKEDDLKEISRWLSASSYIQKNRWLFYLALLMSGIAVTIIVAGFFDPSRYWYLLYLMVFNFTMLSPFLMRTNRYQATISKKHQLLQGYAELLKIIAHTRFNQPDLDQRSQHASEGMKEVDKLSKLLNIFDQRLNMLLGVIFNGFFLFDFIMLHLLENWKQKNREEILEWIELTGWTDAMISLAGFAYNHPDFTVPQFGTDQDLFELKGLGHPLIPDHKRVVNDILIKGEKVVVITGANMAGKSTYLRSLGINTVLAYAGCPVCADTYQSRLMGLCSSMRTADSLRDEESYFLAEIKKLQLIVQRMESGKPLLILLDEVLKGTNTTDKKRGSVGLIRRSLQYPICCFIATHDLSMGELEKEHEGEVVNYCFESYINGMELTFDYTIKKGIATNMNASFLMKQMGIMD